MLVKVPRKRPGQRGGHIESTPTHIATGPAPIIDLGYRACEAYFNDAMDMDQYLKILYMHDDFMVTVLTIEELTSVPCYSLTPSDRLQPAVSPNRSADTDGGPDATGIATSTDGTARILVIHLSS